MTMEHLELLVVRSPPETAQQTQHVVPLCHLPRTHLYPACDPDPDLGLDGCCYSSSGRDLGPGDHDLGGGDPDLGRIFVIRGIMFGRRLKRGTFAQIATWP